MTAGEWYWWWEVLTVFTVAAMGNLRGLSRFFSGLLIKGFMNPTMFKSMLNAIAFYLVDSCGVNG
jgi:hypothetical protein